MLKFNCREKRELRVGPDWEKEPGRWKERREKYVVIRSGTGNRRENVWILSNEDGDGGVSWLRVVVMEGRSTVSLAGWPLYFWLSDQCRFNASQVTVT